jgi:hypothetical protein
MSVLWRVLRFGAVMSDGALLLWRRLFEKEWFKQLKSKQNVVLELLQRANWQDSTLKSGRVLKRGQCVFGRKELAEKTGHSEKEIRTVIKILENVEFGASEGAREGTVFTVLNYEYYQDIKNLSGQKRARKGPAEGPERGQKGATHNKGNKGNEVLVSDPDGSDSKKVAFNFDSGEFENLSSSLLEKWAEAYPAVNIDQPQPP